MEDDGLQSKCKRFELYFIIDSQPFVLDGLEEIRIRLYLFAHSILNPNVLIRIAL